MGSLEPVGGPAAWRGSELGQRDDWVLQLEGHHLDEVHAAVAAVEGAGLALAEITPLQFPLPTLGPLLGTVVDELVHGRGFVLLRGLLDEALTEARCELMFWGLGQHIGMPVPQNVAGELLVHIRDQGLRYGEPLVRGYQTRARLAFHVDSSDVVGLLCVRPARFGGASTILSSVAVHDEIVRSRPDLAEVLYQPFWCDRKTGDTPDSFYQSPVFSMHNGYLAARYGRDYIDSAQRGDGIPPLTAEQVEALDLVDMLTNSPEFVLEMDFQPGDVQLLNNYRIFHARTEYDDWPEPERKRDLIRLWLTLRCHVDLAPSFAAGGIASRAEAFHGADIALGPGGP